ncbi:MAG: uracil-DNA glycosylase [Candidatus Niyogibacteria bacterium]|nr:uracil-DNA glycosylase [Candidatus Niyogibacteria bacterium]
MDRITKLKNVGDAIAADKKLPLYKYRRENNYFSVPGEGSALARIMFVGEAPGRNEARTGRPFCGASGKVLDELLAHIGIAREDVFITSVVKDRPPENRDPTPREIAAYAPYLDRQIEIIQPKVIAALGRFACKYLMEKFGLADQLAPIGDLHGKVSTARASYGEVKIVPLYHPAAAIYMRSKKAVLKKDFLVLKSKNDDKKK